MWLLFFMVHIRPSPFACLWKSSGIFDLQSSTQKSILIEFPEEVDLLKPQKKFLVIDRRNSVPPNPRFTRFRGLKNSVWELWKISREIWKVWQRMLLDTRLDLIPWRKDLRTVCYLAIDPPISFYRSHLRNPTQDSQQKNDIGHRGSSRYWIAPRSKVESEWRGGEAASDYRGEGSESEEWALLKWIFNSRSSMTDLGISWVFQWFWSQRVTAIKGRRKDLGRF